MKATTFFGYICPKCHTTIDIGAIVGGGEPLCPQCKTPMVPNPNGRNVATNVHCKNCNSTFGIINSDKCPNCGTPFEG